VTGNVKTRLMPELYHEIPGSDERGVLLWCRPRQKNCSFHTFAVIASLRLDTAPWNNSTDH